MTESPQAFLARWLPSDFLKVSAGFQVLGGLAALTTDAAPMLPELLLANHLVVAGASVWPTSPLLGPNRFRLDRTAAERGALALTFDDGPDPEVTPRVLDLLDQHQFKASFFIIAERAAAYPDLTREIAARGHTIGNHSYHHRVSFALQGIAALSRELASAQQLLAELTGAMPRHFRAPAGMRNPWLQPTLTRLNLELVSWTRRGFDAVSRRPDRVYRLLSRNLGPGDILLLHDGSRTVGGAWPMLSAVLPRLLNQIEVDGLTPVAL